MTLICTLAYFHAQLAMEMLESYRKSSSGHYLVTCIKHQAGLLNAAEKHDDALQLLQQGEYDWKQELQVCRISKCWRSCPTFLSTSLIAFAFPKSSTDWSELAQAHALVATPNMRAQFNARPRIQPWPYRAKKLRRLATRRRRGRR